MDGDSQTDAPPPVEDATAEVESLAGDFPTATYAEWEELVRAKEKDPERPLRTDLEEGLAVNWLYGPDDALAPDPGGLPGADPFTRGLRTGSPWAIRQRNNSTNRDSANAQILEELEGGATEILLAIDPSGTQGIPVSSVEELDEVLTGVLLDLAPIALTGDPAAADLLLELLRRRGHDPADITGSLRLDPLHGDADALAAALAHLKAIRAEFSGLSVLAVDPGPFVEMGAGGVLELAIALSAGVAYLRAGEAAEVEPAEVAAATEFTLAVGPDQFLEIARLRAFRRLWSTVLEHCGVPSDARRSPLYVRTSRRMYSSLDPWVNMLRATTAAFAAAVGGADGITVLPFDEPYGTGLTTAGPLGRRIARNTQLLLSEESSLHRVADPAGGSWYVESLTDQVARAAWAEFQAIEGAGGVRAMLEDGSLSARLEELTVQRQREIAIRKRSLTGVNQFPLLGDDGLERPHPDAADGAEAAPTTSSVSEADDETTDSRMPMLVRDAAQFEALRERAGHLEDARILLAATGPLSAHVNVALWAKSFFETGGVAAITQTKDALAPGGFRAAAICIGRGSDPAATVTALRDAGITTLFAVGGDIDGVERVTDGVDMVSVLSQLLDRLEETN